MLDGNAGHMIPLHCRGQIHGYHCLLQDPKLHRHFHPHSHFVLHFSSYRLGPWIFPYQVLFDFLISAVTSGPLSERMCQKTLMNAAAAAAAAAKSLQSCLTLYDPIDGRPPASPVLGIL